MTDTPKFEVIDRRKYKAEEEEREAAAASHEPASEPVTELTPEPSPEPKKEEPRPGPQLVTESSRAGAPAGQESETDLDTEPELPPPPTADEARQQKAAYDASSQRLEDLVRAQNPGVGPQPPVTFEHLVNQLYLPTMIQMRAGQEGQRARIDILGAKQTIDLLGILA